jgi:hypothetical protein
MKYYIQRQLNEYGPYTLADLQRYVAQGSILLTDLTRSEGMTDWVPVSQVIGNIPIPAPQPVIPMPGSAMPGAGNVYGATGTVYGGPVQVPGAVPVYGAPVVPGLMPPDFHWALVLLVSFFCSIFQIVWLFIEAGFVKRVDGESKGIAFLAGALVTQIVAGIVFVTSVGMSPDRQDPSPAVFVPFFFIAIAGVVLHLIGVFRMRSSLQNYYNTVEPINLRLSGVMTFFFAVFYFQYHFSRIANWKRTGYLEPQ